MNSNNFQKIIICHPCTTGKPHSSREFIITKTQLYTLLKQEWAYDGITVRCNNVINIILSRSLYYDKKENKFIEWSTYEKRKKEEAHIGQVSHER